MTKQKATARVAKDTILKTLRALDKAAEDLRGETFQLLREYEDCQAAKAKRAA